MTIHRYEEQLEQLENLEKIYSHWTAILPIPFRSFNTWTGICNALYQTIDENIDEWRNLYFTVLATLEAAAGVDTPDDDYWWPEGKIKPRLRCIRNAISLLKHAKDEEDLIRDAAITREYLHTGRRSNASEDPGSG